MSTTIQVKSFIFFSRFEEITYFKIFLSSLIQQDLHVMSEQTVSSNCHSIPSPVVTQTLQVSQQAKRTILLYSSAFHYLNKILNTTTTKTMTCFSMRDSASSCLCTPGITKKNIYIVPAWSSTVEKYHLVFLLKIQCLTVITT